MEHKIRSAIKALAVYGPQIWIILFLSNIAVITTVRVFAQNQSCLTTSQINSDSRCMYILSGNIYEIGSRNSPHQDHPCGMDVTGIIPNSHSGNTSRYLLPNFVGALCTNTPTPVPTPDPTQAPTQPPTAAPTTPPTKSPSPQPTQQSNNSATQNSSSTRSPSPKPTISPSIKPSNAPTNTPTATPSPVPTDVDLGKFSSKTNLSTVVLVNIETPSPVPQIVVTPAPVKQTTYNILYWTTISSYISFIILLATGAYWLFQKIKLRMNQIEAEKNITNITTK